MKKMIAVLFLLMAGPALAAEPPAPGFYAGVNYTSTDYKESGFPTVSPTALTFKLGKELNPNLAIEGRLGIGLSDGNTSIIVPGIPPVTVDLSLDIDNFYGVYLKGMLPTGSITPYGLIGWTKGKLTATATGGGLSASYSDSDSSVSYGIGVDFQMSKTAALNLEYGQLLKGDGYKLNGFSAGVTFKF